MIEENISKLPNILYKKNTLFTCNLTPGHQVYGENLSNIENIEYRSWDPNRSKLAAFILNGCEHIPITIKTNVLYLGAANGTTASHISDIATEGKIYCVEFSSRAFRDLLELARIRKNLYPILEDAFYPERYRTLLGNVDLIYQDISQRDQIRVFILNAEQFLKPNGFGIIMIKSRSIDMTKSPDKIFQIVTKQIKEAGFIIRDQIKLEPYTKDHLGLVLEAP